MKVIAFVTVTLTLTVFSFAYEKEKTKIVSLWKCVACHENAREEYMKCGKLRPVKCKQMSMDCNAETMPGLDTSDKRWSAFCKDEHDESSRYYDCLMSHKLWKELNDVEKTELKQFVGCIKKVSNKFCED